MLILYKNKLLKYLFYLRTTCVLEGRSLHLYGSLKRIPPSLACVPHVEISSYAFVVKTVFFCIVAKTDFFGHMEAVKAICKHNTEDMTFFFYIETKQ